MALGRHTKGSMPVVGRVSGQPCTALLRPCGRASRQQSWAIVLALCPVCCQGFLSRATSQWEPVMSRACPANIGGPTAFSSVNCSLRPRRACRPWLPTASATGTLPV